MATLWVSTSGNNANSGLTYALAKADLWTAIGAASQGDTINVVNDGDHAFTDFNGYWNVGILDSTFEGTSWSDPGLVIRGTDSSGNKALTTFKPANSSDVYGLRILSGASANYIHIEGLKFDYSDFIGTQLGEQAIELVGATGNVRIYDCEFVKGFDVNTNTGDNIGAFGIIQSGSGFSASSPTTVEIARCVFNGLVRPVTIGSYNDDVEYVLHHCVFVFYPDSSGAQESLVVMLNNNFADSPSLGRRYYKNTFVVRSVDAEDLQSVMVHSSGDDTSGLSIYDNLLLVDCGTSVSSDGLSGSIMRGGSSASQTSAVTFSNNAFILGPNLAAKTGTWSTNGYASYQMNHNYRDGVSWSADDEDPDQFYSTASGFLSDVFNSTAAWTWTPDAYDHDLPFDARPTVYRTSAIDGGPVGAVSEVINEPPVISSDWNSALLPETLGPGETVTVTAGDGLATVCSDADSATLTYDVIDDVTHGSLTLNTTDGSFEYTANSTYAGSDSFSFKVCDASTCTTEIVSIPGQNPKAFFSVENTPPSLSDYLMFSVGENGVLTVGAANGLLSVASDPNSEQTLSVTNVTGPSNGTLTYNSTTGAFEYTPDTFFVGSDLIEYFVTDGITNSGTGLVYLTVNEAAPAARAGDFIDTAPFFRPILRLDANVRYHGKRNRRTKQDLRRYIEGELWEESTHRYFNLATNTTQEINLGGVADAQHLIVESDTQIGVSVNSASNFVQVDGVLGILNTAVTSLYVQNSSTDTTARVVVLAVD
jgi:hypothetical protein